MTMPATRCLSAWRPHSRRPSPPRKSSSQDGWLRPAYAGQPTAMVYVDIESTEALKLVAAKSPVAKGAQLVLVDPPGAQLDQHKVVKELPVAANRLTRLAYLGNHVLLLGVQQDLLPGDAGSARADVRRPEGQALVGVDRGAGPRHLSAASRRLRGRRGAEKTLNRVSGPRRRPGPGSAAGGTRSPSMISIRDVISAVLASMIVAEQYFSFESLTAFSTWRGSRPRPATRNVSSDAGEHLRLDRSAIGVRLDHAVGDRLARLPEDPYDVEGAARGCACEHELHRARAKIASARVGCAIDHHRVTASGLGDEAHALDPFDPGLHVRIPGCEYLDAIRSRKVTPRRTANPLTARVRERGVGPEFACCNAICDDQPVRGPGDPPSPAAGTFLHSPPMVESSGAASTRALFLGRRRCGVATQQTSGGAQAHAPRLGASLTDVAENGI